ncbi:MAG: hypothetical protein GC181_14925 [Bacteroidetes bacterium]|nr:hypothetical protein [Bacteroidota bacterium]
MARSKQTAFVVLSKCFSPIEAHLLKNILDNEEIFCQIFNETAIQIYNFHTPSDGGIIIKVHQKDFEKAKAILSSNIRSDLLTENLWNQSEHIDFEEEHKKKPNLHLLVWIMSLAILLLVILYFFGR